LLRHRESGGALLASADGSLKYSSRQREGEPRASRCGLEANGSGRFAALPCGQAMFRKSGFRSITRIPACLRQFGPRDLREIEGESPHPFCMGGPCRAGAHSHPALRGSCHSDRGSETTEWRNLLIPHFSHTVRILGTVSGRCAFFQKARERLHITHPR